MPLLRNYHILISHSWDYSDHYNTVCRWLDESPYFKWTNYSVPVNKPLDFSGTNDLRRKLMNQITHCSCVIILSGMYVNHSNWIDFEINAAVAHKKPIIGVEPWGQERVPIKVKENASVLVGWNAASVVNAVREYALKSY